MNTFHEFSHFDITRKAFDTLFLRVRKHFLLIVNVLYVIIIIFFIIFKVFSKHLYLNNVFRSNDLYHYHNLLII